MQKKDVLILLAVIAVAVILGAVCGKLPYKNDNGHKYDLYIPAGLQSEEDQYLILFIHGGSFNSGAKEDGDAWCKFYATKGYITATADYTLQTHGLDASICYAIIKYRSFCKSEVIEAICL